VIGHVIVVDAESLPEPMGFPGILLWKPTMLAGLIFD
jgi:hypothetical protein